MHILSSCVVLPGDHLSAQTLSAETVRTLQSTIKCPQSSLTILVFSSNLVSEKTRKDAAIGFVSLLSLSSSERGLEIPFSLLSSVLLSRDQPRVWR